jgi:hypothetical protein
MGKEVKREADFWVSKIGTWLQVVPTFLGPFHILNDAIDGTHYNYCSTSLLDPG